MSTISYTAAEENLAAPWISLRRPRAVVITRQQQRSSSFCHSKITGAEELYLLRSPANGATFAGGTKHWIPAKAKRAK